MKDGKTFLEDVAELLAGEYDKLQAQDVKVVESIESQNLAEYEVAQQRLVEMRGEVNKGIAVTLKLLNIPEEWIPEYVREINETTLFIHSFFAPVQPDTIVGAICTAVVDAQEDAIERMKLDPPYPDN